MVSSETIISARESKSMYIGVRIHTMKFLRLLTPMALIACIAGCATLSKTSMTDQAFTADTDVVWTEALNFLNENQLFLAVIEPRKQHLEVHQVELADPNSYKTKSWHGWAECPLIQTMMPLQDKLDFDLDVEVQDDGFTHLMFKPVFTRVYVDRRGGWTNLFVTEKCRSVGSLELDLLRYVEDHLPEGTRAVPKEELTAIATLE